MTNKSNSKKRTPRRRALSVAFMVVMVLAAPIGSTIQAQSTETPPVSDLDALFEVDQPDGSSDRVERAPSSPLTIAAGSMRLAAEAMPRGETETAADAMQQAINSLARLLESGGESRISPPTPRQEAATGQPPPTVNDADDSQNVAADPAAALVAAEATAAAAAAPGVDAESAAAAVWGQLPERLAESLRSDAFGAAPPEYRESIRAYFLRLLEMEELHRRQPEHSLNGADAE